MKTCVLFQRSNEAVAWDKVINECVNGEGSGERKGTLLKHAYSYFKNCSSTWIWNVLSFSAIQAPKPLKEGFNTLLEILY